LEARTLVVATDQGADSWLRFSTDDLPERDRLAIWREAVARSVARLDVEPVGERFRSASATRLFGDLAISNLSITAVRSRRTRELVADGNDDVLFVLVSDGGAHGTQLGRDAVIDAGNAVLVSNADPSSITAADARGCSLRMPRRAILPLAGKLEDAFMRPIPVANPAVQLLCSYIATLDRIAAPLTPTMRHVIATNVQDLVALAVGTSHEGAEIAAGRGARAARFAAIKVDVGANLGRDDLSAAWIAPRHGVSPSHVRRLFAREGTTFGEFVLDYRLTLAHRRLRDPRLAGRTISAIAYALGFGDLSYFNRSFRRRYGGVPSDIRAAAQSSG
jgi:AraC-like DNA-binding protein